MLIPPNSQTRKFFAFTFAKGFRNIQTLEEHHWKKNSFEHLGTALRWGVGSLTDTLLKEIKNPIMIVGLTSLALLAVTIAFYPGTVIAATAKICPVALKIRPWMIKMALYILLQSTIAGIGIRAYGRLCNEQLLQVWKQGSLKAIHVGEKKQKLIIFN